jgi:hypothetical protein
MIITKLRGTPALVALATIGCGAYDPSVEGDPSEMVETETQEIWKASWSPTNRVKELLGVARTSAGRPYAWFQNGSNLPTVCYGPTTEQPTADALCASSEKVFTAPLPVKQIRAIAIKQDNSRVVTWYANTSSPTTGWYSAGNSTDLDYTTGLTVFTPATKPGGGLFSMDLLIDADHHYGDGRYYYYWSTNTCTVTNPTCDIGKVYRSVGSLTDADAYSAATEVKVPAFSPTSHQSLVGVATWRWNLGFTSINYFIGYYHDGFVNVSSSSVDFTQP